jgi:hypothetical protein
MNKQIIFEDRGQGFISLRPSNSRLVKKTFWSYNGPIEIKNSASEPIGDNKGRKEIL